MAQAFKIVGKARAAKVAVNVQEDEERRELITGVSGSRLQPAEPRPSDGPGQPKVIPALDNTYKTGRGKFVPSFVPEASAQVDGDLAEKYEAAAGPTQPLITQYGLEVRGGGGAQQDGASAAASSSRAAEEPRAPPPAAAAAAAPIVAAAGCDPRALKEELEQLPDEADMDAYESMPVEEFGLALLRGMGWKEGEGVGRKRQLVEAKQGVRRPERLGLGANPAAPVAPARPRPRKMGDPLEPAQDLVVAPDADGRQRHRAGASDKLVPRASLLPGPRPGKAMRVAGGRHQGLMAEVLEVLAAQEGRTAYVRVRLRPSEAVVDVRVTDLEDVAPPGVGGGSKRGTADDEGPPGSSKRSRGAPEGATARGDRDDRGDRSGEARRDGGGAGGSGRAAAARHDRDVGGRGAQQQQQQQQQNDGSSRGDSHRHHHHHHHDSQHRQQQQQQQRPPAQSTWVAPLIRVRCLDKAVGGGALYLKKAVVVDVHPGGVCDLRVEGTGQLVTLPQRQLETVVPKEAGAGVLVVAGTHRGRRGRVLQCSTSKQAVAVQLTGDMLVVQLLLDDVAQYTGSLEDDE